jgi:hypothetical protein
MTSPLDLVTEEIHKAVNSRLEHGRYEITSGGYLCFTFYGPGSEVSSEPIWWAIENYIDPLIEKYYDEGDEDRKKGMELIAERRALRLATEENARRTALATERINNYE